MVNGKRPAPSARFDTPHNGLPCFSRHEELEAFGPHLEARVERNFGYPLPDLPYRGSFDVDVRGTDATGLFSFKGYASAEWLREAAAVLLDTANAVDVANKEAGQ